VDVIDDVCLEIGLDYAGDLLTTAPLFVPSAEVIKTVAQSIIEEYKTAERELMSPGKFSTILDEIQNQVRRYKDDMQLPKNQQRFVFAKHLHLPPIVVVWP